MSVEDSFKPGTTHTGPKGQLAHPKTLEHSKRLEKKLYKVGDNAWSLIGNGLSNQSFVEGPEGLICIDTGESNQEMAAAGNAYVRSRFAPDVVLENYLQAISKLKSKQI